jgi:glutamate 5-kinase
VLLTASDIAARTNYLNARQTLRRLIEWGVVPVVNENDTTATDEITFGDNDFLAAQVAILLDARLLVLLTNVDGVFSADPGSDEGATLVESVEDFSELHDMAEIGDRTSAFGSGGMRSKVAAAEMASEAGIPATICNGTAAGTLAAAAAGETIGTRFAAKGGKAPSFKLWLKYAKPAHGRVIVDEGAARVLRERGSSLLPVGIVGVEGEFEAGDAVEVTADGTVVGKGIVDYSAGELSRVIGMKSAEVREVLPYAADEVIHRDRFVLV